MQLTPPFRALLRLYSVLRGNNASTTLPTTSATDFTALPQQATPTSKVPLVVGLTTGLLAIAIAIIGGLWYLNRRRKRRLTNLDVHPVDSYTVPPMTQANQRSALPRDRKRAPDPTQYSRVSTDMSPLDLSEFGPPPSYRGPEPDGSVDTAETSPLFV